MRGFFLSLMLVCVPAWEVDAQTHPDAPDNRRLFAPPPRIDQVLPMYAAADELNYDTRKGQVVLRGNVEIHYNNYVLIADQVSYDQGINKLIAKGNAHLKQPNGTIVRADSLETTDDFRDAFADHFRRNVLPPR